MVAGPTDAVEAYAARLRDDEVAAPAAVDHARLPQPDAGPRRRRADRLDRRERHAQRRRRCRTCPMSPAATPTPRWSPSPATGPRTCAARCASPTAWRPCWPTRSWPCVEIGPGLSLGALMRGCLPAAALADDPVGAAGGRRQPPRRRDRHRLPGPPLAARRGAGLGRLPRPPRRRGGARRAGPHPAAHLPVPAAAATGSRGGPGARRRRRPTGCPSRARRPPRPPWRPSPACPSCPRRSGCTCPSGGRPRRPRRLPSSRRRGWSSRTTTARCRRRCGDGQTTIDLVRPGDAFSAGPDGYTVRPGSVEDTLALLRAPACRRPPAGAGAAPVGAGRRRGRDGADRGACTPWWRWPGRPVSWGWTGWHAGRGGRRHPAGAGRRRERTRTPPPSPARAG